MTQRTEKSVYPYSSARGNKTTSCNSLAGKSFPASSPILQRRTPILISLKLLGSAFLLVLVVTLTACSLPASSATTEPEPEPTNVEYPETLTNGETSTINNLSTATLADSVASMDTIISILSAHSDDAAITPYVSAVKEVRDAIKSADLSVLDASKVENFTKTVDSLNEAYSAVFATEYNAAKSAKDDFESYKNNDFKSAYDALVSAINNVPTENYDAVASEAKKIVEDFKDNYVFNNTYDAAYVNSVKASANAAKADRAGVANKRTAYETAKTTVNSKYDSAVNAKKTYDNKITEKQASEAKNPVITNASDVANIDWSKVESVKVAVPAGTEAVDVLALRQIYDAAKEAAENNGKTASVIDFAEYPDTVKKFVVKNNIELMKGALDKDEYPFTAPDQFVETDLVPGIKVYTYASEWYAHDDKIIQQALKFTDTTKKVDLSQTGYDLTGTYRGGVMGDVEFENLGSTNISGTIRGKSNISPFYDTFIKNTEVENLPNLELNFKSGSLDSEIDVSLGGLDYTNMHGTNIDKIISSYYSNGKTMEFSGAGISFNAKEKLGEGSMYVENVYSGNAYDLDINAALVMGLPLANVNVVGTNKVGTIALGTNITNVRFESDLNGVSLTGAELGVIEFAGDAPDEVASAPMVIFKKVSHETLLLSSTSVNVSALTPTQASNLKSISSASTISELITNSSNAKPSGFNIGKIVVGAENAGYSANDWEKAGNQGVESPARADLSYVLPNKVNQTKSDLIRAILNF